MSQRLLVFLLLFFLFLALHILALKHSSIYFLLNTFILFVDLSLRFTPTDVIIIVFGNFIGYLLVILTL